MDGHRLCHLRAAIAELGPRATRLDDRHPCPERCDLLGDRLHEGLATEALIEALLTWEDRTQDPLALPLSDSDRQLLAAVLMREEEELTPELLEGAIEALHHRATERRLRELQRQIAEAERKGDSRGLLALVQEKLRLERALRPGVEPVGTKAG